MYNDLLDIPFFDLISRADKLRADSIKKVDLCTIVNAKSGSCSEDCKFCAQSCFHTSEIQVYPLIKKETMIEAAKKAASYGSGRFGIVTSGNTLTDEDLSQICDAARTITKTVGIKVCASLGHLTLGQLERLKEAGISRYHHNIETSKSFYPNIVSTHTYADRIETILNAKAAGLSVCCGGIIGLGESWQDRLDMAVELAQLKVDSVPLNILVPVKGTKLEGADFITPLDAIRTIAIFRIIMGPGVTIKVAAGRETILKDYQGMAFMAGASGMLIGGYLTVRGRDPEEDKKMVSHIEAEWNDADASKHSKLS